MTGHETGEPDWHEVLILPPFDPTPVVSFEETHPLFSELNAHMRQYDAQPADPMRMHSMGRHGFVGRLEEFAGRFIACGEFGSARAVLDEGLRAVGGWRVIDGRHYQALAVAAAKGNKPDFALELVRNEARSMARLWGGSNEHVRSLASPTEDFAYKLTWVGAASEVLAVAAGQQLEIRPLLLGATASRIRKNITAMRWALPAVEQASKGWDSNGLYTHTITTAYKNLTIVADVYKNLALTQSAEQLVALGMRLDPVSLGARGTRLVVKNP